MIPFTTKLVLTFFKLVLSPLSPPVGLLHSMFSLLLCLICYCLKIFCRVCPAYFNSLRGGVILGEGGMGRCAPVGSQRPNCEQLAQCSEYVELIVYIFLTLSHIFPKPVFDCTINCTLSQCTLGIMRMFQNIPEYSTLFLR